MNLPELLGLIWLGIVPGAVVVTFAVNLAVNNAASHSAKLPR